MVVVLLSATSALLSAAAAAAASSDWVASTGSIFERVRLTHAHIRKKIAFSADESILQSKHIIHTDPFFLDTKDNIQITLSVHPFLCLSV